MRVVLLRFFWYSDALEDHSALRWMPLPRESRDDRAGVTAGFAVDSGGFAGVVALLQQLQDTGGCWRGII